MTTICTDGRSMAADSFTTMGDTVSGTKTRKLHKMTDGSVIGGAGRTRDIYECLQAIAEGKSFKGDFTLLRLFPDGKIYKYEGSTQAFPTEAPAAIGSGWIHAATAMDCGLSPKEAVRMAAKRDVHTGGRVQEITLR